MLSRFFSKSESFANLGNFHLISVDRLRRDGRRSVEDSDRIRTSLHAPDPKINVRNPTRVVPEVAGIAIYLLFHVIRFERICGT